LTLSVVLHELATNAAKHGALGAPVGQVRAAWGEDGERLVLHWTERGGPAVKQPERRGFGLRLISDSIAHELGGEAAFDFREEGFGCTIRLPFSEDIVRAQPQPAEGR
jgi:two-component sensor histidine kinase